MEIPLRPIRDFFPNLSAELLDANRAWLQPTAIDPADAIILCFQSFLIRTPHHNILIDSCVGNDKDRTARERWNRRQDSTWMDALAAAGIGVEDIDYVLCTHLHVDHVGWNTRLENGRWVPTFPNARYLFSAKELAFWTAENEREQIPHLVDSVLPIVAAQSCRPRDQHARGRRRRAAFADARPHGRSLRRRDRPASHGCRGHGRPAALAASASVSPSADAARSRPRPGRGNAAQLPRTLLRYPNGLLLLAFLRALHGLCQTLG